MKIIYATGIYGEPYKITVTDDQLKEIHLAKNWLEYSPWQGELWINTQLACLSSGGNVPGYFNIAKNKVTILVRTTNGRECVLGYDDDLLKLPSIHVTDYFDLTLQKLVFYLTEGDIDLIENWRLLKAKNLRK
jgi:hypothetical protein